MFAQTGEDRRASVDKMILKRVDSLPHGLINAPALVGEDGAALARVRALGARPRPARCARRRLRARPALRRLRPGRRGCATATSRGSRGVLVAMAEAAAAVRAAGRAPARRGLARRADQRARRAARAARAGASGSSPTSGPTPSRTSAPSTAPAPRTSSRSRRPTSAACTTSSRRCSTAARHGVVAHLGGSCCETERSAQVSVHSRWAPAPTSCWPSPAWASTKGSRSSATRWNARSRSARR